VTAAARDAAQDASVAALLAEARVAGVERLDARLLLAHHLQQPPAWVLAHDEAVLPAALAAAVRADLRRRAEGVPLAYLSGVKSFHGLDLCVTPDVLVPRPDTETLVDWALELLRPGGPLGAVAAPEVVDLGTGSGAIALAVKHACPRVRMRAVDCSASALAVARANGRRLRLAVQWLQGDWWQAMPPSVQESVQEPSPEPVQEPVNEPVRLPALHLALANPPYIAAGDPHLPALRFEPALALSPGGDGLAALQQIVADAPQHLRSGGWLLLEHGHDQGPAVRAMLAAAGFTAVGTRQDLSARPRCSAGKWAR
jgi:release factor glutamine methyltransferase